MDFMDLIANIISFLAGAGVSFSLTFHFTKKTYGNVDNRKYNQKVKKNYGEMNINDLRTIRGEISDSNQHRPQIFNTMEEAEKHGKNGDFCI